jgi:hypothetical protein
MTDIDEWNRAIEGWFNSSEYRASAIIARSAGALTILGAGYIIQDIFKDATRRKPTRNRIMLLMSSCDFLTVFFSAIIGPAMVPKRTGVPGAVGNQLSCDVQGFLVYAAAAASGLYNVSLALCYLLIVRYEYSEEKLRTLQPYFLHIPPVASLLITIPGLPFGSYNFDGTYQCYIQVSPLGCEKAGSPTECERGELFIYWYYIGCVMIFIAACTIIVCMVKMYRATLHRERSGDQFRFSPAANDNQSRDLSNTMRSQGLWYSGAFLFTFFPQFLLLMGITRWAELLFVSLPFNLIGFNNSVIYVRPRFLKFRRLYPNIGVVSSVWHTLARTRPALARRGRDMSTTASRTASLTAYSSSLRITLDRVFEGRNSWMVSATGPSGPTTSNSTVIGASTVPRGTARMESSSGMVSSRVMVPLREINNLSGLRASKEQDEDISRSHDEMDGDGQSFFLDDKEGQVQNDESHIEKECLTCTIVDQDAEIHDKTGSTSYTSSRSSRGCLKCEKEG